MFYLNICSVRYVLIIVTTLLFISGCASNEPWHSILLVEEARNPKLDKDCEETMHTTKANNSETCNYDYKLHFDGYIVGIEKEWAVNTGNYLTICSNESIVKDKEQQKRCNIMMDSDNDIVNFDHYDGWLPDELEKKNILTHVISFSNPQKSNDECILFNAYGDNFIEKNKQLHNCSNAIFNKNIEDIKMKDANNFIKESFINDMREKIEQMEEKPTHIFFISTGWNTKQANSIKNYNDLFKNIQNVAYSKGKKFIPFVVGISWKSMTSTIHDGIGIDFELVGNDADEVGIFWASPILTQVLEPLSKEFNIPVQLIGHSYGCRVMTQAFSNSSLYLDKDNKPYPYLEKPPVFYGLQCAFSGNRFLPTDARNKEIFYKVATNEDINDFNNKMNKTTKKQFYTSSEYDKANEAAFKLLRIPNVGNIDFFKSAADKESYFPKIISQSVIKEQGVYEPKLDCKSDKITLIDASKIINTPTGGLSGAHSDVWDAEAGKLIWDLLEQCNPNN